MNNAGQLRHRLEIQAQMGPEVRDSHGQVTTPWVTIAQRRGKVESVRATEIFQQDKAEGRITTRVLIRRFPGLSNHHRLVFRGRVLNLVHVPDVGPSEPMMMLLATEGT